MLVTGVTVQRDMEVDEHAVCWIVRVSGKTDSSSDSGTHLAAMLRELP
jgi:hypothetical protein